LTPFDFAVVCPILHDSSALVFIAEGPQSQFNVELCFLFDLLKGQTARAAHEEMKAVPGNAKCLLDGQLFPFDGNHKA